ncbi:unnamed protein product [Schistosoma mattheei]|uniref:Uncharacterized protein n=1 Tax=Schistosoma mattheei TaxID=31246 RepID=A0A183Q1J8_9TREM|nr:unnamed protein product [Schistosoma mattheei]
MPFIISRITWSTKGCRNTGFALSATPEPHTEASNFIDEEIPGIQFVNCANYRTNVGLDAMLRHEDDVVSINYEEFNDRNNNIDEDSDFNGLSDMPSCSATK